MFTKESSYVNRSPFLAPCSCFSINGVCNCPDASRKRPTIPVNDEVATKKTYKSNTRQVKGEANSRACSAMVSCDVKLYEIEAKCPTERIHMSSLLKNDVNLF